MNVKRYAPCNLGRTTISLGKQGEGNALRIEFDCSSWLAEYPDAVIRLYYFAPERAADNPIRPVLGEEGTDRVWIVSETDTANAGNGVIELVLEDAFTGARIKSKTGYTTVTYSPSAVPLSEGGGETGGTGEDGGYYKPSVSSSGDLSWEPSKAGMPSVNTVNIKGPKGNDGADGKDGKTGPQGPAGAAGADGQDATLEIMGADSLAYGSEPTVTEETGSTPQARKYRLGIPEGKPGTSGTGESGSVELDTTLTKYGQAADAGAVGNAIGQEKQAREQAVNELKEANDAQDQRLTTLEQAVGVVTVEPACGDVPLLFYGAALPQTKDEAVMSVSYASKTLKRDDADAETKAQGNSSLSYPKKNQTTKFSQAINFKNWGLQKKYCMKANWIDLTHARNIVSAQLWGDVVKSRANYLDLPELLRTSPNQGAVDGFPALVYANDVYQGRYTINIPKDAWMANMDDSLGEHCILCSENYASGCFRASANINGSDWTDEIHDTVPTAIKTRWNEVISFVMNSTDEEFKANLSNYFYVDSLIDYLLFGLASCGLDAFGKNQLYMTYDGQKWIASMYDMDSTWGLYWNGSKFVASDYPRTSYEDYVSTQSSGEGNLLYIRLENLFYEDIQTRWAELREGALSYANIMMRFERFIGVVPPHIVKEDYASTTGGGKFTGIPSQGTNHIQQIRSFAAARLEWTDEYVASLTPVEKIPCTGITLNQTVMTFDGAGTQVLTATVTPSNTTDTVTWLSDDDSIASVINGVVTAKANGETTITATCGEYSATCAVSVSGISDEDDETVLYRMPSETVFDGSSTYIDTGVQLAVEDIDFTIILSATGDTGNTENDAVFHCMNEASPYPGYAMACYQGIYKLGAYTNTVCASSIPQNTTLPFKAVFTHVAGSGRTDFYWLYDGNTGKAEYKAQGAYAQPYTWSSVTQNLLIGCYQTTSGVKGRYWTGTLHEFVLYNRAYSADEVNAYLV